MNKFFKTLFGFFSRKAYNPDQSNIPRFDFTNADNEGVHVTPGQSSAGAYDYSVVEELKKAKAEIEEFEKAIKEIAIVTK